MSNTEYVERQRLIALERVKTISEGIKKRDASRPDWTEENTSQTTIKNACRKAALGPLLAAILGEGATLENTDQETMQKACQKVKELFPKFED